MKRYKNIIISIFMILFSVSSLILSSEISVAVTNSIEKCLKIVIPSLFAFLVISSLIVQSGLYKALSKPFRLFSRYILHIDEKLFSIFLISFVGGYPIGAKILSEVYDNNEITKKNAEKMLSYCFMPSPALILGISHNSLFSSSKAGLIIYFSIALSSIIYAIISGLNEKSKKGLDIKDKIHFSEEMLVSSVESASISLYKICIMIIFSSVVIIFAKHILNFLSFDNNIKNLIISLIEVTSVTELQKNQFNLIPAVTAVFSFGGLSVILQLKAITKNRFSYKKFFISRIFIAIFSFLISKIAVKHISITASVVAITVGSRDISPIPSVILIIMTILLLYKKTVANKINL